MCNCCTVLHQSANLQNVRGHRLPPPRDRFVPRRRDTISLASHRSFDPAYDHIFISTSNSQPLAKLARRSTFTLVSFRFVRNRLCFQCVVVERASRWHTDPRVSWYWQQRQQGQTRGSSYLQSVDPLSRT